MKVLYLSNLSNKIEREYIENDSQNWHFYNLHLIGIDSMKILLHYALNDQSDQREQFSGIYNKNMTEQEDHYVFVNHPELLIVCDNCQRKLNKNAHVLLIISSTERKDLCFTCLNKIAKDFLNANYYVRPNLNLTLTQEGWCILSQLMLFKGLQKFNFGNWKMIKDYMDFYGFNFTIKQIEDHYKAVYLSIESQAIFFGSPIQISARNKFTPYLGEQSTQLKEKIKNHSLQVYNPERQQFILDFNPQAEDQIADLEFFQQDTPQEEEMKLRMLEIYNQHLKERKKRQQVVTQHKLLSDEWKKVMLEKGNYKHQIRRNLNCFSRFMTYQESQNLMDCLALQQQLFGTLNEFGRYRTKLNEPNFNRIYESMKKVKEIRDLKRQNNTHSGDKIKPKKRRLSMITVEEMRNRLNQRQKWKNSMKVTCLNSSLN